MAKAQTKELDSATPFRRFERLARKLVAVPKREADKVKRRQERAKSKQNLSR